jgi:hypothetical protein
LEKFSDREKQLAQELLVERARHADTRRMLHEVAKDRDRVQAVIVEASRKRVGADRAAAKRDRRGRNAKLGRDLGVARPGRPPLPRADVVFWYCHLVDPTLKPSRGARRRLGWIDHEAHSAGLPGAVRFTEPRALSEHEALEFLAECYRTEPGRIKRLLPAERPR